MAKAKKTKAESSEEPKTVDATAPASSKKKSGAKKPAAKADAPAGIPLIDTSAAAQAAAKLVANRDLLNASRTGEKRESAGFKQMKESLHKPVAQGPAGILQSPLNQKKSNTPFGGRHQIGHNQTFGADVNRTGVPRRTGG